MRPELVLLHCELRDKVPSVVTPSGNDFANIIVVADRPDPEEKEMFTGSTTRTYRRLMLQATIKSSFVYATYFKKARTYTPTQLGMFKNMLAAELRMIKPRAIVFFGLNTFNEFFGTNYTSLRNSRIIHQDFNDSLIFVTRDVAEMNGESKDEIEQEFVFDMVSVLNVNEQHFPDLVTL